ncbi:MAG: type II secretion system protein [Candidatus Parvarchaeum acidiphilum ARMAN-4]|jgi:flagellar protein FlaJ|uniref:Type II secretion system protein n=1 Tax=Candidatus Parvarchaeum acidiphilum ARMAN-4 TaxID=662760 RepID=D2EF62_PARA4|nr:MAG: type II secretion system protein [Candidatus Parvarchaeum acidiphilum ARMAN-4]
METKIPSIMISPNKAVFFGKKFKKFAPNFKGMTPTLKQDLLQAAMDIDYLDYIAAGIVVALVLVGLMVGVSALVLLIAIKKNLLTIKIEAILPVLIFIVPGVYFFYFLNYPKLQAVKRTKLIEEQVVFATREIMIKVGSGVPVFNALLDVANGNYGVVSDEFKEAIEEIESGVPQEDALDHLARRVPSQSLRRTIDIMLNAIKSGSDVAGTLSLINDMLIKKQQSDMKSYAGELTPMSMAYMLISVVMPSLGMSVFIILGSLAHFNTVAIIYIIPPFLLMFQIFFMGMVGNRRPSVGV